MAAILIIKVTLQPAASNRRLLLLNIKGSKEAGAIILPPFLHSSDLASTALWFPISSFSFRHSPDRFSPITFEKYSERWVFSCWMRFPKRSVSACRHACWCGLGALRRCVMGGRVFSEGWCLSLRVLMSSSCLRWRACSSWR